MACPPPAHQAYIAAGICSIGLESEDNSSVEVQLRKVHPDGSSAGL